ncbi:hypothetical protein TNCV_890201 [Trichonephila clavipes]|nr:hypothetical protein TNCV_890201 [Trichonephila clavipes]
MYSTVIYEFKSYPAGVAAEVSVIAYENLWLCIVKHQCIFRLRCVTILRGGLDAVDLLPDIHALRITTTCISSSGAT